MEDHKAAFSQIQVMEDETGGLLELEPVECHGSVRKTKIKNNFVGQLTSADSGLLLRLVKLLNAKFPVKQERDVVVGLMSSGITVARG